MSSGWCACCKVFDNCAEIVCSQSQESRLREEKEGIPMWKRVVRGIFVLAVFLFFLYFFLVGLDLMGNAFKVLAGESAGSMFTWAKNPFAGLMIGILATVLVQSSSTTTSIIVTAVGAGALQVQPAIPMIFGANIGTSVTNTIVSMGFAGNVVHYERAFSGATVHDLFNILNVILWFVLDGIVNAANGGDGGILYWLSWEASKNFGACDSDTEDCEKWVSPIKTLTDEVSKKIISPDKDVIKDFSRGEPSAAFCPSLCAGTECEPFKFYRKKCANEPYLVVETCEDGAKKKDKAAFAFCDGGNGTYTLDQTTLDSAVQFYEDYKLNKAGVFYDAGWSDEAAGTTSLILSIIMLCICLAGLVKILSWTLRGAAEQWVKRALDMNGYLAILVGAAVTVFVQSSSITTSVLTPLVAVGALTVEGMVPLTFGANIGTTFTGIMAALVGDSQPGMQIALVHVFFNLFGVIIFYPIPAIRKVPIAGAKNLGKVAARFRPFPTIYVFTVFAFYPLILLGLSMGYEIGVRNDSAGTIAGTTIALLVFVAMHLGVLFWYKRRGGREKILRWIDSRNLGFSDQAKEAGAETIENEEGVVDLEKRPKVGAVHVETEDNVSSEGSSDTMDEGAITQA